MAGKLFDTLIFAREYGREAFKSFDSEAATKLLHDGANPNETDSEGRTFLLRLAQALTDSPNLVEEQKPFIELLIEKGADLSATDKNGDTVLHISAFYMNRAVWGIALAAGADPNAKNKDGLTPWQKLERRSAVYDSPFTSLKKWKSIVQKTISKQEVKQEIVSNPDWVFGKPDGHHLPSIHGSLKVNHAAETFYGIDDNLVIVRGGIPDVISCVDTEKGQILWQKATDSFAHWFYENGILYFGNQDGNSCSYMAVDANTGNIIWQTKMGTSYKIWHGYGPFLKENLIIFTTPTTLTALNKADGKKQYATKLVDYNDHVKPVVWNDLLILVGAKSKPAIYGYDFITGDVKLTFPLQRGVSPQVSKYWDCVLSGDIFWYCSDDASLRSVDLCSGETAVYSFPADIARKGLFSYSMSEADGVLWITTTSVKDIDLFGISFDTHKKVYGEGRPFPLSQDNRWKKAKAGIGKENLSIEVGGQTLELPSLGGDDRLWEDFQLENGAKLVLQRVGADDENSDESILYLVY